MWDSFDSDATSVWSPPDHYHIRDAETLLVSLSDFCHLTIQ